MNITDKRAREVCKIGQGEKTCAYCMVGGDGFECAKGTSLEAVIKGRLANKRMVAQGDNCQGMADVILEENKEQLSGN